MNSKWHFYISWLKSLIRIFACGLLMGGSSLFMFGFLFCIAEGLGMMEEIKDDR